MNEIGGENMENITVTCSLEHYQSLVRDSEQLRCIEKIALNESDTTIATAVKDILVLDEETVI